VVIPYDDDVHDRSGAVNLGHHAEVARPIEVIECWWSRCFPRP
jgi:hypothetical protein